MSAPLARRPVDMRHAPRKDRCRHGFLPPLCPTCDKPDGQHLNRNGAWSTENDLNYNFRDMVGLRVGRLVVVEQSERRSASGTVCWVCRCDCGEPVVYDGIHLRKVRKQEREGRRRRAFSCPECRGKGSQ